MKSKTCCFSGHRKIPSTLISDICIETEKAIETLIKEGYCYFGSGGALGFDTIAAISVIKLRKKYPFIRLILVLPCLSQTRNWRFEDKQIYEKIKNSADKVVYVSKQYTNDCMHLRNRHLVNNSSACICFLTEQQGGTAYTVSYAKDNGLRIINIADVLS